MLNRLFDGSISNSFFLFGARGTGKTHLLKTLFHERAIFYDFLDPKTEDKFASDPSLLKSELLAQSNKLTWTVIDEVQKVPQILNVVHELIESQSLRFAMTGSSARKLKRENINLLAGRAFVYHLHPFTHVELGSSFCLQEALEFGTLPKITHWTNATDKKEFLYAYAQTYLKEEIQLEQLVRNLRPFRRFLNIAAQTNTKIVNYSKIAQDVGTTSVTVQSYFEILEDTLVGFLLPAYHRSLRKQQRQNPKFYFFDPGVKRALDQTLEIPLLPQTSSFGEAFEHWVILETFRLNDYLRKRFSLSYLRTKDDAEVDLVIERPGLASLLIEIKSSDQIFERDIASLQRFKRDFSEFDVMLWSRDPRPKIFGKVKALPWELGLQEIGLIEK